MKNLTGKSAAAGWTSLEQAEKLTNGIRQRKGWLVSFFEEKKYVLNIFTFTDLWSVESI